MSDPTPGLPRKQTRIGPKYDQDEPPRVQYRGGDDGVRSNRRREGKISGQPLDDTFEPTKLTPAPQPGDPLYVGNLLHSALEYAFGIKGFTFPNDHEVQPLTMEQEHIMDQVVWRLKNDD